MKPATDILNGTLLNSVSEILDLIDTYRPELAECQAKLEAANLLEADAHDISVFNDLMQHMVIVGETANAAITTLHNMQTLHSVANAESET